MVEVFLGGLGLILDGAGLNRGVVLGRPGLDLDGPGLNRMHGE